jgi:hypothetical protein
MRKQLAPHVIDEIVPRVRHAADRITQAIRWARSAQEVWRAFNDARYPQDLAGTRVADVAAVFERTTLEAVIIRITRVLDQPSARGHKPSDQARATNRLSFPVCRELISLDGVLDRFADDATIWNARGAENAQLVRDRFSGFCTRLDELQAEHPNRQKRVRDFRDENIAHELRLDPLPDRPRYEEVWSLLNDTVLLTEDLSFVVHGSGLQWSEGKASRSAELLWEAVAKAFPPRAS